jgi:hypothetical protein
MNFASVSAAQSGYESSDMISSLLLNPDGQFLFSFLTWVLNDKPKFRHFGKPSKGLVKQDNPPHLSPHPSSSKIDIKILISKFQWTKSKHMK